MHDLVYGGSIAEEVVRGYEQAWKDFGRIGENGHYNIMMSQDTKAVRQNIGRAPWVDAWCGALMNMWNREFRSSALSKPNQRHGEARNRWRFIDPDWSEAARHGADHHQR